MAHCEDRWHATVKGPHGKPVKVRTNRHPANGGNPKSARWRARYLDPDGRERNRSFATKVMAEKFLTEVEHSKLAGSYRDPDAGRVTLRKYAKDWVKGYHAESTRGEALRSQLDNHIVPGLGAHTLAQLAARPSIIQQWLTGLPLGRASAGQVLITLGAVLSAAEDDGLIPRNPCKTASVRLPKAPHRKVVPWTAVQVAAVRESLPARYRAMVECGAGLGLRQGETFAIGPDEIDFLRRKVHVRRQVKRVGGRMWFAAPKGGRERDVPLADRVSLALAAHIAEYPPVRVTLPWNDPGSKRHGQLVTETVMFTGHGGGAVNASTFNGQAWARGRKAAGTAHDPYQDGMHALRHYFASVLLAGGVDIRALSEYLGHHDPAITLRIYAHLMPQAETRALGAIEEALRVEDHGPGTAQEGGNTP